MVKVKKINLNKILLSMVDAIHPNKAYSMFRGSFYFMGKDYDFQLTVSEKVKEDKFYEIE
jgi:hypothetical protein